MSAQNVLGRFPGSGGRTISLEKSHLRGLESLSGASLSARVPLRLTIPACERSRSWLPNNEPLFLLFVSHLSGRGKTGRGIDGCPKRARPAQGEVVKEEFEMGPARHGPALAAAAFGVGMECVQRRQELPFRLLRHPLAEQLSSARCQSSRCRSAPRRRLLLCIPMFPPLGSSASHSRPPVAFLSLLLTVEEWDVPAPFPR